MNRLTILNLFMILCWGLPGYAGDIIFFSESPGEDYYEYSWGFDAGNSFVELAGPRADKFPVDARHSYRGQHSLRLRWRSSVIGDWGITVATRNWEAHDFTACDSIEYWINGPAAITRAELPDLALEDRDNRKSSRVWLGDYLDGVDADSSGWQKVAIPIGAFEPGPENCDFTRIKSIFHFQKNATGVEQLMWLDEIRATGGGGGIIPGRPFGVSAKAHDSRVDLRWNLSSDPNVFGYFIYRSPSPDQPFTLLNLFPHSANLYSDFIGHNDQSFYYYLTASNAAFQESLPSDTVSATPFAMTTEELLTSVQEATFRYFYDHAHPVSGMARESDTSGDLCATGGSGFGLMAMVVGVERGFVSRSLGAGRVLKLLRFLQDEATRYHGAWSHWINGASGATIPFSQYDDGGDLVETAYLVQGLLIVRQYFNRDNTVENEIRLLATRLWEAVEWDWYRRTSDSPVLYWHWSPNFDWRMNLPIRGFNETMIVYLLAVASPTHPVPASLYHSGWAGRPEYVNGKTFYGYTQWVGPDYGGPLFFTHYSYLGFDPRGKADDYANYFENNRNISLIHRAYCIENPLQQVGYDSLVWGLTASRNPWGYSAQAPFTNDNGTITPTAALSAMPYIPEQSIATLRHFYYVLGPDLWGEFGFRDAFNPGENWYEPGYLAIDQGPIVVMIENYRTRLCWNLFMSNPEIPPMLAALGFRPTTVEDHESPQIRRSELGQNYPNPFNGETVIRFNLAQAGEVDLDIFNVLGERVRVIYRQQELSSGAHRLCFDAGALSGGIYFYRMKAGKFIAVRKMLLVK